MRKVFLKGVSPSSIEVPLGFEPLLAPIETLLDLICGYLDEKHAKLPAICGKVDLLSIL
jgi:hypothetical protein